MKSKNLEKIIKNHQHWLDKDCDGWEEMKADLRYANLRGAKLSVVDLSGAKLRGAKSIPFNPIGMSRFWRIYRI